MDHVGPEARRPRLLWLMVHTALASRIFRFRCNSANLPTEANRDEIKASTLIRGAGHSDLASSGRGAGGSCWFGWTAVDCLYEREHQQRQDKWR